MYGNQMGLWSEQNQWSLIRNPVKHETTLRGEGDVEIVMGA